MSKLCSCIVPCFNEEEVIPLYYEEMQKVRKQEEGKLTLRLSLSMMEVKIRH